ncbi:MAG TPA: hypothetical protein VIW26_01245 [Gemmatimonadales bacterium]
MVAKRAGRWTRWRWVYAYELNPPQPEPRFRKIRALLRRAQLAAQRGGRLWTGRIVVETSITHILVVTDTAGQVHDVDRAIEVELKHLNMDFALTGPARFSLPGAKAGKSAARRLPRSNRKPRAA